jgi:hypothetical protein
MNWDKAWDELFKPKTTREKEAQKQQEYDDLVREFNEYVDWVHQVAGELHGLIVDLEHESDDKIKWDLTHRLIRQIGEW